MSGAAPADARAADAPAADAPAKRTRWFRSQYNVPQLSADAALREGRIIRLALDRLGAQGAQAFLNTHHEALDGRPLAIATGSQTGALAVEQTIAALPK